MDVVDQQGTVAQTILNPLVILSMRKTIVTKVINALKSVYRVKIFPREWLIYTVAKNGHRSRWTIISFIVNNTL